MTMMIGHLANIETLHQEAVLQNAAALDFAKDSGDTALAHSVLEGKVFLDIVAEWITEAYAASGTLIPVDG